MIILSLKVAVIAVTLILLASLWALKRGQRRLHGQLNHLFFGLTMLAVVVFEVLLKIGAPVTEHFSPADKTALTVHLCFVIPLVPVMILMLITGRQRRRSAHLLLANLFILLWAGMFVTGVFFLPH